MQALGVPENRKMGTQRPGVKVTKSAPIVQEVKGGGGVWRFIIVKKSGSKYPWGDRPGAFFLE